MKANDVMTNEELQKSLTERIRGLENGTTDPGHAKIYFTGARALLGSVKIDIDGAKRTGSPLFARTKKFLGVVE